MRWHLARDRTLLSHAWDGQCVVYDSAAGDTHLLDGAVARLFVQLGRGPCDEAALAASLCAGASRGRRGWRLAGAVLAELAALGLVERAP